ncbi:hypothetical protein Tco_0060189 [Tanacetum coccineum]
MLKLRAIQEGLEVRMTDDDVMDKVLGTSRGFTPGWGRKLPNSASFSSRIKTSIYHCPFLSTPTDDANDEGDAHEDVADPGDE